MRKAFTEAEPPLTPADRLVFVYLNLVSTGNIACESMGIIGWACGLSRRQVIRSVQSLEERGWVVVNRGKGRANHTHFTIQCS